MKRREFIALLSGVALCPLAARAQQPDQMRQIGVLMARKSHDVEGQKQFAGLQQGLMEHGWLEGRTIHIETRWTVGDPAEALKFTQELIGSKPEVLVANGTPSLVAMRQAAVIAPVVFVSVADPVGQGFVPSLSRPNGNITGFSAEEASMGGKWLELLKELAPQLTRIVILYNPDAAPYAPMFFPAMRTAAPKMAVSLSISPVHSVSDIEGVFAGAGHEPGSGLIVVPDSYMFGQRQRLIALAAEHRLPTIYPLSVFVEEGGLIAYGIERVDMFHRAAAYVDRILRGASVADLPVQQPTKFELLINLKTAKELGITVPRSMLLIADEVIE